MRAVPRTPAQVETNLVLGEVAQGVVERVHADLGEGQVVLHSGLGVDLVPGFRDGGVVDLDGQAGIDNGLVLLAHGVRAGVDEFFIGRVVLVANARAGTRGECGDEAC